MARRSQRRKRRDAPRSRRVGRVALALVEGERLFERSACLVVTLGRCEHVGEAGVRVCLRVQRVGRQREGERLARERLRSGDVAAAGHDHGADAAPLDLRRGVVMGAELLAGAGQLLGLVELALGEQDVSQYRCVLGLEREAAEVAVRSTL